VSDDGESDGSGIGDSGSDDEVFCESKSGDRYSSNSDSSDSKVGDCDSRGGDCDGSNSDSGDSNNRDHNSGDSDRDSCIAVIITLVVLMVA
jgi:hypothetical protein